MMALCRANRRPTRLQILCDPYCIPLTTLPNSKRAKSQRGYRVPKSSSKTDFRRLVLVQGSPYGNENGPNLLLALLRCRTNDRLPTSHIYHQRAHMEKVQDLNGTPPVLRKPSAFPAVSLVQFPSILDYL